MIRAIVWKEWREQRVIALAVLAFGALALALTARFADPTGGGSVWSQAGARELMAQALAYLAGTVCGAMLLADEKEIGTLEFLDTLPARRRGLWVGKVVFGVGLAVVQCAALAGLAVAFGCVDARVSPGGYAAAVVLVGLLAFAWGLFGGALARSTLGAVFLGSVGSVAAGVALAVPFILWFGPRRFGQPAVLLTYHAAWLGAGLLASAVVFTAVDRERRVPAGGPVMRPGARAPRARPSRRPRLAGLRALAWLSVRQAVFLMAGVFAGAAVLGAVMLAPEAQPVFLWPVATLAFGVLAGVTTLGEEQTRGVARFWAERRLPLGKLWLVKAAVHFALACGAGLVLFVLLAAANPGYPFRTRLLAAENLRAELPRFLLLGLVYGFVVGHLAGMLFRKTAVAGLVAGLTAVTLVGLIFPSVIGGGAAGWQVWGPALVLLATARLLLHPWATDRVATRGPVLRAAGGAALAIAVLAVGLGYRVYEIPDAPDRLAESGFIAGLPTFDENQAGRDARTAVKQYGKAAQDHQAEYPGGAPSRAGGPSAAARPDGPLRDTPDLLLRVGRGGWGPEAHTLGPWLDKVFAEGWVGELDKLADRPAGVFDDPSHRDYFTPRDDLTGLEELAAALRARGMQRLHDGDPAEYPRLLRGGLAVVRSARNKGGVGTARSAATAEEMLLRGLNEWVFRERGRPELLRPLLADLVRHEREAPTGGDDVFWAEQVILRNTMDRVATWLPRRLTLARWTPTLSDPHADNEAELVTFAWNVPWERVRRERLLRVRSDPDRPLNLGWLSELHLRRDWQRFRRAEIETQDKQMLTLRRLAVLRVALRLYQFERGGPAPGLAALVPDYLPAIPADPFGGGPFGYRVARRPEYLTAAGGPSRAELAGLAAAGLLLFPAGDGGWVEVLEVTLGSEPARAPGPRASVGSRAVGLLVRRGDAVLWSAGPDGTDDGGVHPIGPLSTAQTGEDWIVPIPTVVRKE